MSCKSAIYVINTADGTAISANGVYAPNQIVRRFGPSCQLSGNGINITGYGYYDIDATVSLTATAVGAITAQLYQDGSPIAGAFASETASAIGDVVTLPLTAMVRLTNCQTSNITVVVGTASTSNNLALRVEKR